MQIQDWHKTEAIWRKGTGLTVYQKLLPGEEIPNWPPDVEYKTGEMRWRVAPKLVVYTYRAEVDGNHVRIPKGKTTTKILKAGDSIPTSKPRRYFAPDGYVNLRWKVGLREYVEVREHRVQNGKVVDGIIHHRNGVKADNRPDNLCICRTDGEHARYHRTTDREKVKQLYLAGKTTVEIANQLHTFPGNVSRMLRESGVQMRHGKGLAAPNRIQVDENLVKESLIRNRGNISAAVRETGISRGLIRRVRREAKIAGWIQTPWNHMPK
jgi:HNH endonuclease